MCILHKPVGARVHVSVQTEGVGRTHSSVLGVRINVIYLFFLLHGVELGWSRDVGSWEGPKRPQSTGAPSGSKLCSQVQREFTSAH